MQQTSQKNNNTASDESQQASFGGSRYKRNYDKYKSSETKSDAEFGSANKSGLITAVSVFAFVLLTACLLLFVTNTVLLTKGRSLFAVLAHGADTGALEKQTDPAAEALLENAENTVAVEALGITVKTVTTDICIKYGIPAGCYVLGVANEDSQFKPGDIIVSADGKSVTDADQLISALSSSGRLSVYRSNGFLEIGY